MELNYGDTIRTNSHGERLYVIELLRDIVHPVTYNNRNRVSSFVDYPYLGYDREENRIVGYYQPIFSCNVITVDEFISKAIGKPKTYEGEIFKHKFF